MKPTTIDVNISHQDNPQAILRMNKGQLNVVFHVMEAGYQKYKKNSLNHSQFNEAMEGLADLHSLLQHIEDFKQQAPF